MAWFLGSCGRINVRNNTLPVSKYSFLPFLTMPKIPLQSPVDCPAGYSVVVVPGHIFCICLYRSVLKTVFKMNDSFRLHGQVNGYYL